MHVKQCVEQTDDIQSTRFRDSNFGATLNDLIMGTKLWKIWSYMAVAEIRRRYRRTLLGPLWTTLSLAIFIGSMSILFSALWKTDIKTFLPFFSAGFICWTLISSIITESCSSFVSVEGLVKQISFPYSCFSWLVIARNLILFAHHAIVYIFIAIVLTIPINSNSLFLIPGLLILCLTAFPFAISMGLLCARYRDLQQVVNSVLQISLFVTPVFWTPDQLNGSRIAVFLNGNPLYHYVNIIRMPMLGQAPESIAWIMSITVMCATWLFTLKLFNNKRKQLVFWL